MSGLGVAISSPLQQRDRLDFVMPDFVRLTWVSDRARDVWVPRFQQILRAWMELEWTSVASGLRKCALLRLSIQKQAVWSAEWNALGLASALLQDDSPVGDFPDAPLESAHVVVGSSASVRRFKRAWELSDHHEIGDLLGYPECCRDAFIARCIHEKSVDPTWATSADTVPPSGRLVEIEPGSPLTNVFWRFLGIRGIFHLPCRFDCQASIACGQQLLAAGTQTGYLDEMNLLVELLSWPVEWSGLHGIAEVKSPVLKVCTRTDATAAKYVVCWMGDRIPEEGARGLKFPYKIPARKLVSVSVNSSRSAEDQFFQIQAATPPGLVERLSRPSNGNPRTDT